jgi:hypothetical protein
MRFLLAGATAMALLGPTSPVAADPCVCLAGDEPAVGDLGAEAPALPLSPFAAYELDAPASEPTMGDDALSRPIEELSSPPLFMMLADDQEPSPEQVLWCEGSDDPRCTPGTSTPATPEVTSPPPAAVRSMDAEPGARPTTLRPFDPEGLRAARGTRRSIERPPRG